MYQRLGKRLFDLLVTLSFLPLALPVVLVVACLVRFCIGAPVLLRQTRPGLNGRPFQLYKFRTMTEKVDSAGRLLPDQDRLMDFGRRLRSTSLDELPEIWNVLRGEMSLVGPRPLLMQYLARYNEYQKRRHDVHPGITGWAQVQGRNSLEWERRFALDVWYVEHQSFVLDLKILWKTVWLTLLRRGISYPDSATMPEFLGTPPAEAKTRNT